MDSNFRGLFLISRILSCVEHQLAPDIGTSVSDVLTQKILIGLPKFFKVGTKARNKSRPIMEVFEVRYSRLKENAWLYSTEIHFGFVWQEGTVMEATIPEMTEPPRLVGIGDPNTKIQFTCYIDRTALFADYAVEAVLNLVAAYHVLHTPYPQESKVPFLFLAGILLREVMTAEISKFPSIMSAMMALA